MLVPVTNDMATSPDKTFVARAWVPKRTATNIKTTAITNNINAIQPRIT